LLLVLRYLHRVFTREFSSGGAACRESAGDGQHDNNDGAAGTGRKPRARNNGISPPDIRSITRPRTGRCPGSNVRPR